MSIFSQPFLSVAGQKERLGNVVNTLGAAINPFDSNKVESSIKGNVGKALSIAANNPYTAAAAIAIPISKVSVLPSVLTSTKSKLIAGAAAIGTAAYASGGAKPTSDVLNVIGASTPERILSTISGAGKVRETPTLSNAKSFAQDNAGTLGVLATVGLVATGGKIANVASNIYAGSQQSAQTEAVQDLVKATEKQTKELKRQDIPKAPIQANTSSIAGTTPITPVVSTTSMPEGSPNNPIINASVGEEPKRRTYRKRKPIKACQPKRKPIYRKIYKEELFSSRNGLIRGVQRCSFSG